MSTPHTLTAHAALNRVIEIFGSQLALATALNLSKGVITQWKLPRARVPAKHCPIIEEMTQGVVLCEDLRPDIRWDVVRHRNNGGVAEMQANPLTPAVAPTLASLEAGLMALAHSLGREHAARVRLAINGASLKTTHRLAANLPTDAHAIGNGLDQHSLEQADAA